MFPAARKGDPITHDMLVPSGVIGPPVSGACPMGPVLIEFLPAAHMNCTVVCSGATSPGPVHPPTPPPFPPIVMGSTTVLIHGMPAARWTPSGDIGVCGVFLGDPKLTATRTVLIGGPSAGPAGLAVVRLPNGDLQVGPNITIKGTMTFQGQVMDRLATIATTPSGLQMLANVTSNAHSMTITEYTGNNSFAGPTDFQAATAAGQPVFDGAGNPINSWMGFGPQQTGTGTGSDVNLQFNPNLTLPNSADPTNPMPNDAVLFHEMNHGAHQMNGTYNGAPLPGWTTQEEQNTISTGAPSEASYLRERGYPWQRNSHGTTFVPNP